MCIRDRLNTIEEAIADFREGKFVIVAVSYTHLSGEINIRMGTPEK